MRIANNIAAMTAHRHYTNNLAMVARAMERLSTGFRINRAADDAAGLAISEKMRAQIRGLNRAAQNVQDARSLIQTAEGAVASINEILQRMNELAVQAATGTLSDFDRKQAAKEFEQLKREINDISGSSHFNNISLLDDGSMASAQTVGLHIAHEQRTLADGTVKKVSILEINPFKLVDGDEIRLKITAENGEVSEHRYFYKKGDGISQIMDGLGFSGAKRNGSFVTMDGTAEVGFMPSSSRAGVGYISHRIQTGALEGEQLAINIPVLNTRSLGLDSVNLNDQDAAGRAITAVKHAQEKAIDARTTLGAMQNRLDYKLNNLKNQALNLSEAESRIRDADMAEEMTNLIQAQMRVQLSIWVIAQMNITAQRVLDILLFGSPRKHTFLFF